MRLALSVKKLSEDCEGQGIRLALYWNTVKLSHGCQRRDDVLHSLTKACDRSRSPFEQSSLLRCPGCHDSNRTEHDATLCREENSCKAHLAHNVICATELLWQGLESPPKWSSRREDAECCLCTGPCRVEQSFVMQMASVKAQHHLPAHGTGQNGAWHVMQRARGLKVAAGAPDDTGGEHSSIVRGAAPTVALQL